VGSSPSAGKLLARLGVGRSRLDVEVWKRDLV